MIALVRSLTFNATFPRKFFYIRIILDYAIKEFSTVQSKASQYAFDIINILFYFLPIPHQRCMENSFKKFQRGDYSDYLFELKKTNENAYYYHEICNVMETKAIDAISKIFAILENKEKPRKKSEIDQLTPKIIEFSDNVCKNSTNELFDMIQHQFCAFLTSEKHINGTKDISFLLRSFLKRNPDKILRILVPHVLQALLTKETDTKQWDTPLGYYFKKAIPSISKKAESYSINKYLSNDGLFYYLTLLGIMLECGFYLTNGDSESSLVLSNYKEEIEMLIMLFMLETEKHKFAGHLIYSVFVGCTTTKYSELCLEEQTQWKDEKAILESYKSVGQFDPTKLKRNYNVASKKNLEYGKLLIENYCYGLGSFVLKELEKPGDLTNLVMSWLTIASKIIPGCIKGIRKEGDVIFGVAELSFKKACEDAELSKFYLALRPNLIEYMNKLIEKVKQRLGDKTTEKYPTKIIQAILCIISFSNPLAKYSINNLIDSIGSGRKLFKNPTCKDKVRKHKIFLEIMEYSRFQLAYFFDKLNEEPFPNLEVLARNLIDVIQLTPNLVNVYTRLI